MAIDEFSLKHPDNRNRRTSARIIPLSCFDPKYIEGLCITHEILRF